MMWLAVAMATEPLAQDELRGLLLESAQLQACEVREVGHLQRLSAARADVLELRRQASATLDTEQTRDDDLSRELTGCRAAVVELHAEAVRVLDEEQQRDDDQLRQLVELQAVTERQARQLARARQQRAVLAAVVVGLGAGVVGALAL